MKKIMVLLIAALFVIFGLSAGEAKAAYDLKYVINGGTPTGGDWLTANFMNDGVNTNTVNLTLTSHLANDSYFFQQVAFNVNPYITLSSLTITQQPPGTYPGTVDIFKTTQNAQNMNGSGDLGKGFDVLFKFPTANNNKTLRFNDGDSVTFIITRNGTDPTLTPADFDVLNDPTKSAHIGAHLALGGSLSSGIGDVPNPVPIPGAIWLLGSGLIGIVGIRRKFKK